MEQKLIGIEDNLSKKNDAKEDKELDKLIENFLNFEKVDQIYLYRLIKKLLTNKQAFVIIGV